MDEPLEIPNAAYDAAHQTGAIGYSAALRAAAPLIVAVELRHQADELHELRQTMRSEDDRSIRSSGLAVAVYQLRTRANELDPQ